MAQGVIHVEWLNQNAHRAYPLSEEATRRDVSGSFVLPDDLLVDFSMAVDVAANQNPANFYLSSLSLFGTGVELEFSYWDGAPTRIGKLAIPKDGFVRNTVYSINGEGVFAGTVARVVVGSLTETLSRPGAYQFNLDGGRLEPAVIVPDIRGLSGLRVVRADQAGIGELLQGDVAFEAGANMRISVDDFAGTKVLTFHAIDGEGLEARCECVETQFPNPLRTINEVEPDELGNIDLLGDDCIEVTPEGDQHAVQLTDLCSKPCCGCPELDQLTSDQAHVRDQVITLTALAERLQRNIDTLSQAINMIQV